MKIFYKYSLDSPPSPPFYLGGAVLWKFLQREGCSSLHNSSKDLITISSKCDECSEYANTSTLYN